MSLPTTSRTVRTRSLFRRFAKNVPERDIYRTHGGHANAFAAKGHRLAIHVLPQKFGIPGIKADQNWLQITINDLLGCFWCERGIADPDMSIVGEHFNDQPAVKSECAHGNRRKR